MDSANKRKRDSDEFEFDWITNKELLESIGPEFQKNHYGRNFRLSPGGVPEDFLNRKFWHDENQEQSPFVGWNTKLLLELLAIGF